MDRPLRRAGLLASFAALLLLTGCMMSGPVEDLYTLPQLPEEYKDLREQLTAILDSGAEYAPPQSGANLPAVQMVDLDGDGSEEALAFFRVSGSEERPLRICIFRASGDAYEQAASIDGSGTAIHSIRYEDMDGDGTREILVSWQAGAEVQTLVVYALRALVPEQLVSAVYARYELADLDGDGAEELILLRSDDTEPGTGSADLYGWDGGELLLRSSERISVPAASVLSMQTGALRDGDTAVFVTGREAVSDENSRTVTDILAFRQSGIANVVLSPDTGVTTEIYPYAGLQPADINGDGATEVPAPEALPGGEGESARQIRWFSYDLEGAAEEQALTYHNLTDGWYLLLPESWDGRVTAFQNNVSASEHTVVFSEPLPGGAREELFTIYALTGSSRETLAARSGRTELTRRGDVIYAVSFSDGYDGWRYAVDPEELSQRFRTIVTAWSMSEN